MKSLRPRPDQTYEAKPSSPAAEPRVAETEKDTEGQQSQEDGTGTWSRDEQSDETASPHPDTETDSGAAAGDRSSEQTEPVDRTSKDFSDDD